MADDGIRIDVEAVRAHLHNLYDLATRDIAEVEAWDQAAFWSKGIVMVTGCPAKTYMAALFAGVVARSMNSQVDATTLMADAGPGGYSAATVWKEVARFAGQKGFDIRGLGPAPLNNSPFLGKRTVDPAWQNVLASNRFHLTVLHTLLEKVNSLSSEECSRVAALLIKDRLDVAPAPVQAALVSASDGPKVFRRLVNAAATFMDEDPEGGRRGQAFVSACYSLVYETVESDKVNDPSRSHPGDVRGYEAKAVASYAEAKQKVVTVGEVERFVEKVAKTDAPTAVYAALAAGQKDIPIDRVEDIAMAKHGVFLKTYTDPWLLARDCAIWSSLPTSDLAARFDAAFIQWMSKMGVKPQTLQEWAAKRDMALGIKPST